MSLCGEIENLEYEREQHIKALCNVQSRLSRLKEIDLISEVRFLKERVLILEQLDLHREQNK